MTAAADQRLTITCSGIQCGCPWGEVGFWATGTTHGTADLPWATASRGINDPSRPWEQLPAKLPLDY